MNIYDIAKKCNVSIATVSRVINNSDKVSAKTRDKVKKAMKEADYTPNAFARGLGLGSMRMIGLLCTDVSDLYYAKAVSLIEKNLRTLGFDTLLCCSGQNIDDKKKALDIIIKKNVDAVVLIGSTFHEMSDNTHIIDAAAKLPVFIVNGDISADGVYCVLCDERKAMYNNVEYLAKKGVKEILYLYDTETFSGKSKLSGIQEGIKAFDIKAHIVRTEKDVDVTKTQTAEVIEKNNITGIIASEDLLAIGALKAVNETNKKISVIGFNNSLISKVSTPALTSVDNMLDELCPMVSELVSKLLSGQKIPSRTVLDAKIVKRDT